MDGHMPVSSQLPKLVTQRRRTEAPSRLPPRRWTAPKSRERREESWTLLMIDIFECTEAGLRAAQTLYKLVELRVSSIQLSLRTGAGS